MMFTTVFNNLTFAKKTGCSESRGLAGRLFSVVHKKPDEHKNSRRLLHVQHYTTGIPKGGHPFRLALVSDIHDRNPEQLIKTLQNEKPDIICVAGDLMERNETGAMTWTGEVSEHTMESMDAWMGYDRRLLWLTKLIKWIDLSLPGQKDSARGRRKVSDEYGYHFLREVSLIAPVYLSMGNHEWYHTAEDMRVFRETGTILLDNQDLWLDEFHLRIGGLSTRYDLDWLGEFSEKDGYKILLCHHPEYFDRYVKKTRGFQLVLAGHVHGGQWRFKVPQISWKFEKSQPIEQNQQTGQSRQSGHGLVKIPLRLTWKEQGFYGPGQGLFPKYHHGLYKNPKGNMIVCAGASNTGLVPRFGNPREIAVIDFREN